MSRVGLGKLEGRRLQIHLQSINRYDNNQYLQTDTNVCLFFIHYVQSYHQIQTLIVTSQVMIHLSDKYIPYRLAACSNRSRRFRPIIFHPTHFCRKSEQPILGQVRWLGSPPQALEAWFVVTQGPPQALDAYVDLVNTFLGEKFLGQNCFGPHMEPLKSNIFHKPRSLYSKS